MAEWKDVIHQIVRICKLQEGACGTCVLSAESCPNSVRFDLSDEAGFANIEKAIMAWAADHPEPVYPTWWKYMCMIGVIPNTLGDKTLGEVTVDRLMQTEIPADIAEKLGIEPKEER